VTKFHPEGAFPVLLLNSGQVDVVGVRHTAYAGVDATSLISLEVHRYVQNSPQCRSAFWQLQLLFYADFSFHTVLISAKQPNNM